MNGSPLLSPLPRAEYRISVVLPVFSETDSVLEVASGLRRILGTSLDEVVIVLSPRSSAESRAVCESLVKDDPRFRIHVQVNNPGLGHAVREGYALTRGNLVLNIDSDNEMEIESVGKMVDEMARGGFAMVSASRWAKGGGLSGYGKGKYWLNWGFQKLFRVLFWTRSTDLTYGYKLMRGELARGIVWKGELHEIACETTLKPIRLGVPVSEVATHWRARTQGVSKNTFLRNFRYVSMALGIRFGNTAWAAALRSGRRPPEPASAASVPCVKAEA
jgi:dolichol-phosphate mannosyltransferase